MTQTDRLRRSDMPNQAEATGQAVPNRHPDQQDSTQLQQDQFAFLHDERFLNLWHEANTRSIRWEEFSQMEMPAHADPRSVWDAINVLRQQAGTSPTDFIRRRYKSPIDSNLPGTTNNAKLNDVFTDAITVWCNFPKEEMPFLDDLLRRGRKESPLGSCLLAKGLPSIGIDAQTQELVATLAADRKPLGYERVRAMVTMQRNPRSDAETICANYTSILSRELLRPSTADINSLYRALCDNVGVPRPSHVQSTQMATLLDRVLASAEKISGTDVICSVAYIWEGTCSYPLYGLIDATFGSLLRKVFLIRCGYPALALIPLSASLGTQATDASIEEIEHCDGALFTPGDNAIAQRLTYLSQFADADGKNADVTKYDIALAHRMDHLLSVIERELNEHAAMVEDIMDAIRESELLNYRQKDVIIQCLDDSNITLDFNDIVERYRVTYATARSDLNALVKLGLLYTAMSSSGRLDFFPVPDLPDVIDRRLSKR